MTAHLAIDQAALQDFEKAWLSSDHPALEEFLPAPGTPVYADMLAALVCLEIRLGWQQELRAGGERPRVETYLRRFPALREGSLALRVIQAEYLARHSYGDCPSPGEYLQRFPEWVRAEQDVRGLVSTAGQLGTASPKPTAVAEMPAVLGRYRVLGKLGAGSFGTVYRGHDEELDRPVAIKVPHRHVFSRPEEVARFVAEARILASLNHPNLVPVYDAGSADGLGFVVSKLIEGSDLAKRLTLVRLTFAQSAEVVAALADALHYAHRRDIVHRDVKPANILLESSGQPYLTDFGLAIKERSSDRPGELVGTPAYMSPEQARGEGHRVDGRSDIFSVGVVFYELLTGRRPCHGESQRELLEQIISLEARPPRQVDDAIPKELERICLKALAKRASERYTTARDMADDLRHFLTQAGPSSAQVPPAPALTMAPAPRPTVVASSSLASEPQPFKIVPKGLRSFDANDADFFLELLPGPRDRDGLPESVRFWKTRIEEKDPEKTFCVGLIYGPSGCGKSSLVKAALLPRLAEQVVIVYVEATADETEFRLLKGLRKRCSSLSPHLGLKETLAALRRGQGMAASQKVLIVLDQFEQWLHAQQPAEDTELVQALRQCDSERVQAIVLVRDDFGMAATRFMAALDIPIVQGQNFATIDRFDLRHAKRVLTAFGRAFGALPDTLARDQDAFLDQAVAGLAQEGQVISVRLALFAEMVKGKPWTLATLKQVGGTEGVGVAFLEETFSSRTANPRHRPHQKAARAVLKALLPESGSDIKGHMRTDAELLEASGYGSRLKDFADLIRILDSEIRLITPTDPEGKEMAGASFSQVPTGQKCYQLTHDYLVHSLRHWLTRKQRETRRGRAELRLAERAAIWTGRAENRYLPSWWECLNIYLLTRHNDWSDPQRKMMGQARGLHAKRLGMIAILLGLVTLGGLWVLTQAIERNRAIDLVDRLLDEEDITRVPDLTKEIEGHRNWTGPKLQEAYAEAERTGDARRQLRAGLALLPNDYGNVDYLYGHLLDAQPLEAAIILNALGAAGYLSASQGRWAEVLSETVKRSLDDEKIDNEKEVLAKRQANAAVALLRMGHADPVWPLFRHRSDPRARSYLIHRLSPLGADPDGIFKRLKEEQDVSSRRALLLSLGEFTLDRLDPASREPLLARVWQLYREDSDSGVHGAAEWSLRQWAQQEKLTAAERAWAEREWAKDTWRRNQRVEQIRLRLAKDGVQAQAHWYVNGERQTMVVIPRPVKEFQMGSPTTELGRVEGREGTVEKPHQKRIVHSFAIAAREVTVEQFRRFRQNHKFRTDFSPREDCAVNNVTWYDAAEYCNWLSAQEGIPPDQWCYVRTGDGDYAEGIMKLAPDYLQREGYRLPSEAEWEYACRAGARTSRYYGETEELLPEYAWFTKNSWGRGMLRGKPGLLGGPGDSLKPNDLGLFDMLGNAAEWCQEQYTEYKPGEDKEDKLDVKDKQHRVLRGGSFFNEPEDLRSANRHKIQPSNIDTHVGFRPARTLR